jgi:integrase
MVSESKREGGGTSLCAASADADSADASSPATRLDTGFTGAYKLVDATVVASAGWADLSDGALAHAIDREARIMRALKGTDVPVPELVADLLAVHLVGMGDGPLVRTAGGHRLSAERLRARLTSALYRAGVKHGPLDGRSSHVLRRTCATALLESGASLVDVQAVLGHADLSSTSRYLALPDVKRLRAVIEGGPLA